MFKNGDILEVIGYSENKIKESCFVTMEEVSSSFKIGDKFKIKELYDSGCANNYNCDFFQKHNICYFLNNKFDNRVGRPCYIKVEKSKYYDKDIYEIKKYKQKIEKENAKVIGKYTVGTLKEISKYIDYDYNGCFKYKDGKYYFNFYSSGSVGEYEYSKDELENIIRKYNILTAI